MKNLLILFALAALLAGSSCKKDAPEAGLPPATQTGANTAGCLINGEPFVAKSYGGNILSSPIEALSGGFYFDSLYYLSMNGLYKGKGTSITLFLRRPKPGSFLLNRNTLYYPQGHLLYTFNHATYQTDDVIVELFGTTARCTGEVVFTKVDKSILLSAGTFSFKAVSNKDSSRVITITNGRFDIKQ